MVAPELTTVSDSEAVFFTPADPDDPDGTPARVTRYDGLRPGAEHTLEGVTFRTLDRAGGPLLCTVATVNDLHFGETHAGIIDELPDIGPILTSAPGEPPYPETMNGAAAEEIARADPTLVVAKGDLTDAGSAADLDTFERCYGRFGTRLVALPGNHDVAHGTEDRYAPNLPMRVDLPGVTLALLDTTIVEKATGRVGPGQLEWLDEVGRGADRPVLVMGHHHPWAPGSRMRPPTYFGISPDESEALVEVFARRPRLALYAAGHTHRNRVRRFGRTGDVPWVEVASVKEFPGCWAEYRVYEGGIAQIVHRVSRPDALRWSERTRALYGGQYPAYAFGALTDRSLLVTSP
ncbi:MAG TPA: metallophosphoesterase [Acidimicrobiales bacterium]|nr:metallophosphoesterase [Acidimicrobiales bacterium]